MVKNLSECGRPGFSPWIGKIPWRKKWVPTPVFLPGEFHGQRSLTGNSLWGPKELDAIQWLICTYHIQAHTHTHTHTHTHIHTCAHTHTQLIATSQARTLIIIAILRCWIISLARVREHACAPGTWRCDGKDWEGIWAAGQSWRCPGGSVPGELAQSLCWSKDAVHLVRTQGTCGI